MWFDYLVKGRRRSCERVATVAEGIHNASVGEESELCSLVLAVESRKHLLFFRAANWPLSIRFCPSSF